MRKYESIVIFDAALTEEALDKEIKKLVALLEANGGTNVSANSWGRKEIAYFVGRHRHGYFVAFTIESENYEIINLLTTQLRLNENVVKFQSHLINQRLRKFKGRPGKAGEVDFYADDFGDDSDMRY